MTNWYTKIPPSFREHLKTSGKSYLDIEETCVLLLDIIDKLYHKIPKYTGIFSGEFNPGDYEKHRVWYEIAETLKVLQYDVEFCKDISTKSIPQDEWEDYSFDGDLLGMINGILSTFYDVCDTQVGANTKFCWVEI